MAVLGRYQLLTRLAVGGMAEVYLARTAGAAGFSKVCVIKRILPHLASKPDFVQMFLNEARLLAELSHPNVVQSFELGQDGETYFMSMEYVDGGSLMGLIRGAAARGERVPDEADDRRDEQHHEKSQHPRPPFRSP